MVVLQGALDMQKDLSCARLSNMRGAHLRVCLLARGPLFVCTTNVSHFSKGSVDGEIVYLDILTLG